MQWRRQTFLGAAVILLAAGAGSLSWWFVYPQGRVESFTDFAEDIPRVQKGDVNKHFRSVWGRNPTIEEWRYWYERTNDTRILYEYLDSMKYYHSRGESPKISNTDFTADTTPIRLHISTAARYLFQGDKINIKVDVTNDSPLVNRGVVETVVNTTNVVTVIPPPKSQTALSGGRTKIISRYDLEAGASSSITVQIKVPSPAAASIVNAAGYSKPTLVVEARIPDVTGTAREAFRVVESITENQANLNYPQRQVPIIFLHVYDRLPTTAELGFWRSQLPKFHNRLGELKGAMETARNMHSTGDLDANITVADVNAIFRSVYGRGPTVSEQQYWAGRVKEKSTRKLLMDAMAYHQQHGIGH